MLNIVPVLRLVDIQGFVTTNSNMLDFPIILFNFLTDQRADAAENSDIPLELLNCIEKNPTFCFKGSLLFLKDFNFLSLIG